MNILASFGWLLLGLFTVFVIGLASIGGFCAYIVYEWARGK